MCITLSLLATFCFLSRTSSRFTEGEREVMELTPHGLLEELLAPRREAWNSLPSEMMSEFFPNGWSFDIFDDNPVLEASNPSFLARFSTPPPLTEPNLECPLGEANYPFADGCFTIPEIGTSHFPTQEGYPSMVEDEEMGLFSSTDYQSFDQEGNSNNNCCKLEMEQSADMSAHYMSMYGGEKKKAKKIEGQPSKNLMAERRRRKRLNDRLSMLRSIVPKISKMDRTAILSDTIDYMRELLEKINKLQEDDEVGSNPLNLMNNYKQTKPNEALVRNSPKFDVESRETDTKIDICCAAKPGLLLSTVNTIEALGLEIEQCVISCFNDFSLQASCSEGPEQRSVIKPQDIKQALFRNAGYGGRCL